MKQKVVIKVSLKDKKYRKKALSTVVVHSGVESTAFQGQEKDKIEVVGDGIDAVALTTSLRKNVGFAELVSVSAVDDKKEAEPKPTQPDVIWSTHPYVYSGAAPYHVYGVRDCSYDPSCTIM